MFIEFGTLNYKLFFILFSPIGYIIEAFLDIPNPSLHIFFVYLSFLSSGIIYLIILFRSRSKNKTEISVCAKKGSAISQIDEEQKKEKKKKKIKEKIFIFLLALLFCLPDWIKLFFGDKINNMDSENSTGIDIISIFYFCIFFSKLILRDKIYKHRIISIIIMSICYLILILISGFFEFKIISFLDLLLLLINCFSKSGSVALFYVLCKKHFNTYLTDPYLFIFYFGLFSLLNLIPLEIIYYFLFDGNIESIGEGIISLIISNSKEFLKNLLYFPLLIPLYLFTYGSQILIIYHFTPSHYIISLLILFLTAIFIISNDGNFILIREIVLIICSIIMFIFSLVYNEIIIIKLCSMEKYTAKYISIREKNEYENMDQAYSYDEDDDELNNSIDNITSTVECKNVL